MSKRIIDVVIGLVLLASGIFCGLAELRVLASFSFPRSAAVVEVDATSGAWLRCCHRGNWPLFPQAVVRDCSYVFDRGSSNLVSAIGDRTGSCRVGLGESCF